MSLRKNQWCTKEDSKRGKETKKLQDREQQNGSKFCPLSGALEDHIARPNGIRARDAEVVQEKSVWHHIGKNKSVSGDAERAYLAEFNILSNKNTQTKNKITST